MLERQFDLMTSPDVERFNLHNNVTNDSHIVTMADVEIAFADNPIELTRVKNNKSVVWFLEKIY